MRFLKGTALSCLLLLAMGSIAQGDIPATTDSGKKVILNEDGTWKYREPVPVIQTFTGQNLLDEYRGDMMEFLNGFTIIKE